MLQRRFCTIKALYLENKISYLSFVVLCIVVWALSVISIFVQMEQAIEVITAVILLTIQLISSIQDLYTRTIPIKLLLFGLTFDLFLIVTFCDFNYLISCISGSSAAFFLMLFLILISRGQVGGGDLVLLTVTGFFGGIASFLHILFISIILSGSFSLVLLFIRKGNKNTDIPYAPFILFATAISI